MQSFDLTTLRAVLSELRQRCVPSKLEQVYQRDRTTLSICLRTLAGRSWLTVSWHPTAARVHLDAPPPRDPDTFVFSDRLRHQLKGLALVAIALLDPWERVLDLQFARRPGDEILWHLYAEIMGKRSNAILVDRKGCIVAPAHQVNEKESRLRPVQTGDRYVPPPALTQPAPNLTEGQTRWQERVGLIPGKLSRQLLKAYRGLSPATVEAIAISAGIDPEATTTDLSPENWQCLYARWQEWLQILAKEDFCPQALARPASGEKAAKFGYTVLPWGRGKTMNSVQDLLREYYTNALDREEFHRLHDRLTRKVENLARKQREKVAEFQERLQESDEADSYRDRADLLVAYSHIWQPGTNEIVLPDFTTQAPIAISLDPEKNAIQNAQALYRRHQKLKRARLSVEPLLAASAAELQYLERVAAAIAEIDCYRSEEDLQALAEIQEELTRQGYLSGRERSQRYLQKDVRQPSQRHRQQRSLKGDRHSTAKASEPENFYRYQTPNGFEILVGRNDRQNERLNRIANEYDLWFHAQEISGSHVLLRLPPGAIAGTEDLQAAANSAAYHSRSRQSESVPVVYAKPKNVYKPKGAKPGTVIYKKERVLWGNPQMQRQQMARKNRS